MLLAAAGVTLVGLLIGYAVDVVVLFPSAGASTELVRVPELVGMAADEARSAVEETGLGYAADGGLHHPRAAAGRVVAQDPLPEQMARRGTEVSVTLSLGPKERSVPDVVGLDHQQARVALERAGFRPELTWVDSESNVGEVVGTRPAPGTGVELPAEVRLLASAGPPRVEVPDLVTRSLPEARSALERLGLRLGTVARDSSSLAAPGTVIAQSPGPGAVVDRSTRVGVTVAVVPPPFEPADSTPEDAGAADGTAARR